MTNWWFPVRLVAVSSRRRVLNRWQAGKGGARAGRVVADRRAAAPGNFVRMNGVAPQSLYPGGRMKTMDIQGWQCGSC